MQYGRSLSLGIIFFTMQLLLILLINPEKNWVNAWLSLASHWDSEWYEAIATYGYVNEAPLHTGLTSANVVFFPGYPYAARILTHLFPINAKTGLLFIAQFATLSFWCLFFHILRQARWWEQFSAALLVMSFPTSWFFYTAYSESLFTLTCCLMLWLSTKQKWVLSGISGMFMTATRIIGLPTLAAPLFSTMVIGWSQKNYPIHTMIGRRVFLRACINPMKILLIGSIGCLSFFIYCAIHFGSWHLYFDMERFGWKGTADPWFLFQIPTWLPPPFGYKLDFAPVLPIAHANWFIWDYFRIAAYTFSETLVPIFLWVCIFYSVAFFKRNRQLDSASLTWYFAAILIFLFNCFSLSTRYYESMSRCLYPVWILLIMSDLLHPERVFLFRLKPIKLLFITLFIGLVSAGFWLQLLERFFLGWWVA